jgi:hypothetical protein
VAAVAGCGVLCALAAAIVSAAKTNAFRPSPDMSVFIRLYLRDKG